MKQLTDLHIYEEVTMLALRDKEGTMLFGINYHQALAGALLAELLLKKKIEIEYSGKKKFVKLLNRKQMGDKLLDESLGKIVASKRRARIETWVQRLSSISKMKSKAAQSLCRRGILKLEENKVLLIFKRKVYPEVDPKPEQALIEKMDQAIFGNTSELDPETIVLIAICNSTGILKQIFDKKKLKGASKRIREITSGDLIGKATKDAVEAMQAAVMVATFIPIVAAAGATT